MLSKKCPSCNVSKTFLEYHPRSRKRWEKYKNSSSGYHHVCKECTINNRKLYLTGNSDKAKSSDRNSKLKRAYGITVDDYNAMYKLQNGKCKVCGERSENLKKGLVVDHCHSSLKIRGLLCMPCNLTLGYVKDNKKTLKKLINYLNYSGSADSEIAQKGKRKVGY